MSESFKILENLAADNEAEALARARVGDTPTNYNAHVVFNALDNLGQLAYQKVNASGELIVTPDGSIGKPLFGTALAVASTARTLLASATILSGKTLKKISGTLSTERACRFEIELDKAGVKEVIFDAVLDAGSSVHMMELLRDYPHPGAGLHNIDVFYSMKVSPGASPNRRVSFSGSYKEA